MAVHRRCSARSAAVLALACSLASWVALATTFVFSGSGRPRGLRGDSGAEHQVSYQTFGAEEPRPETMHWASWVPAAAFALAFGLSMVSTPVRAEDNVQINVQTKEERLEAQKQKMIQEQNNLADNYASRGRGEEGNEGSIIGGKKKSSRPKAKGPSREGDEAPKKEAESATPAKSAPAPAPEPDVPKKKKVIISPADEIDPDELPSEAPNPPLLFAVLFGPATLFLIFWFLGSLNII